MIVEKRYNVPELLRKNIINKHTDRNSNSSV